MKPILKWSCRELNDGWVMIGVDCDLSAPDEPECTMGMRQAVHPFQFDEAKSPVIAFTSVISEMDKRMRKAVGVSAPTHSASRACAFDRIPSMFPGSKFLTEFERNYLDELRRQVAQDASGASDETRA